MASLSDDDNKKLEELKGTIDPRQAAREEARRKAAERAAAAAAPAAPLTPEEQAQKDAERKQRKAASRKKSAESLKAGERTATPRASTVQKKAEIAEAREAYLRGESNRSVESDQAGKPFATPEQRTKGRRRMMFKRHYDVLTPDLGDYKRINVPNVETPIPPELTGRGTTPEGTPLEKTHEGQFRRAQFLGLPTTTVDQRLANRSFRVSRSTGTPDLVAQQNKRMREQKGLSEHLRDVEPTVSGYTGAAVTQARTMLPQIAPESPKGETITTAYELADQTNKLLSKMQAGVPNTGGIQRPKRSADDTLPRPTRQRFRRRPGFEKGQWVEESLFPEHRDPETGKPNRIVRTLMERVPGPMNRKGQRNMVWRSVDPSGGTPLQPEPVVSAEAPVGTKTEKYVAAINGVPTRYAERLALAQAPKGSGALPSASATPSEANAQQESALAEQARRAAVVKILREESKGIDATYQEGSAESVQGKPTAADLSHPKFDDPTALREASVETRKPSDIAEIGEEDSYVDVAAKKELGSEAAKRRQEKKRVGRAAELAKAVTDKQSAEGRETQTIETRTTPVFASDTAIEEARKAKRASESAASEAYMQRTMTPQQSQTRNLHMRGAQFTAAGGYGEAAGRQIHQAAENLRTVAETPTSKPVSLGVLYEQQGKTMGLTTAETKMWHELVPPNQSGGTVQRQAARSLGRMRQTPASAYVKEGITSTIKETLSPSNRARFKSIAGTDQAELQRAQRSAASVVGSHKTPLTAESVAEAAASRKATAAASAAQRASVSNRAGTFQTAQQFAKAEGYPYYSVTPEDKINRK